MARQSFVSARETGPFLKHCIEMDFRTEIENIVGETIQVQSMDLNEDLRRDFVNAVKYSMKFVLTEDRSFGSKMKINDTFVTSFTDALVSKGKIMTFIVAQVRRTFIDEISKMEKEVMEAQQWKAEAAPEN